MRAGIRVVTASAGSGKTHRLAELLEEALASGEVRPEAVVAVTFTNKAAAEMEERARRHLLRDGRVDDAQRLSAARIGSVHAVCAGLLRDFALELGLSPRQAVLDERAARLVLRRAFSRSPAAAREKELADLKARMPRFEVLSLRQQVLDGARANGLDATGLEESRQRSLGTLRAALGAPADDAAAILEALAAALDGFAGASPATDLTQATQRARDRVRAAQARLSSGAPLSWDDWAALASLKVGALSAAAAEPLRQAATGYLRLPAFHADLERAVLGVFDTAGAALDVYAAYKREHGVVDFADQLALALELLRRPPIREQLAEEIDLLLVDEFQDTSPIQLALFLELAGVAGRAVWVGDPKQSIFSFLGTDPVLMDAAVEAVLGGEEPETLALSWRSRPDLVRLTSDLYAPAFEAVGIPASRVRLEPSRDAEPAGLGPILERWRLGGRAAEQVAGLAAGVLELLDEETVRVRDTQDPRPRRAGAGDVAILCRTNEHCQAVANALATVGVPTVLPRSALAATPEAQALRAGLALWSDPRDSLAAAVLSRFDAGEDLDGWLEALLEEPAAGAVAGSRRVAAVRAARRERPGAGVLEAFDALVAALAIRDLLFAWGSVGERLANLEALRAHAVSYCRWCEGEGAGATVGGFLAWLGDLEREHADSRGRATAGDAVTVSTWHAAKGLEWPIVVLWDLDFDPGDDPFGVRVIESESGFSFEDPLAGRWIRCLPNPFGPWRRCTALHERLAGDPTSLREASRRDRERLRLLYVGWTRARDRLVLATRQAGTLAAALEPLARTGLALPEPVAGTVTWVGRTVEVKVRELGPASPVPSRAGGGTTWERPGPRAHPEAFRAPSAVSATGRTGAVQPIGERMALAADADLTRVGEALHRFLAADRLDANPGQRRVLAEEILARWGVDEHLAARDVVACGWALRAWAGDNWPQAVWHREWPLAHRLADGSIVRGSADLVLELASGFVLVDHKSFPGGRADATAHAAGCAGQLAAYAAAVEAATGKPLLACFIHLPVSGLVVEVCLDEAPERGSEGAGDGAGSGQLPLFGP